MSRRRYGDNKVGVGTDVKGGKVGLKWKIVVAFIVGLLFWLRFHYCYHPVINPGDEQLAKPDSVEQSIPVDNPPVEHPPGPKP
jgi:hypothetical protein